MPKQDEFPSVEELMDLLGLGECPHEKALANVALLLTAAAMRHGGRLEFSDSELQDAGVRMMAIHTEDLRRTVVVEALVHPSAVKAPTHNAPGGLQ